MIGGWVDVDADGIINPISREAEGNSDTTAEIYQVYDAIADEWTEANPPEVGVADGVAIVTAGAVLVVGGLFQLIDEDGETPEERVLYYYLGSTMRLNLATGEWE